jgi:hypothetical protein
MAAPKNYLKKRDLLWNPRTPAATLAAAGWEYFREEAYSDALDYFERAREEKGLEEVKRLALKEGDAFLLFRLGKLDPKRIAAADWEEVARAARAQNKESMALFAERQLHPPEQAREAAAPGAKPLDEIGLQLDQQPQT